MFSGNDREYRIESSSLYFRLSDARKNILLTFSRLTLSSSVSYSFTWGEVTSFYWV